MVDGETTQGRDGDDDIINQFARDVEPFASAVVCIEDDQTDALFAEYFAEARAKRKEIEDWFEGVKRPINEALRRLNAKLHELCDPLKVLEDRITQARAQWLDVKNRRIEEVNKQAIIDSVASGTGVAIIAPDANKTVSTATGDVTIRKQPSWRLTDDQTFTADFIANKKAILTAADPRLSAVPPECFVLSPSIVSAMLKAGKMPDGPHSIERYEKAVSQLKG